MVASSPTAENSAVKHTPGRSRPHRPALSAAFALAIGIVIDRSFHLPMSVWLSLGAILLAMAGGCYLREVGDGRDGLNVPRRPLRRAFLASFLTLAGILSIGGARHHLFWSIRGRDDIARFSTVTPRPARLIGIVDSSIEIIESGQDPRVPTWMKLDRSTFFLQVEQLQNGTDWEPVSGRARVDVDGHLLHAGIGDRVELLGKLSRPAPPRNPGGYDFPAFLRAQGADSMLHVSHPLAVTRMAVLDGLWWRAARLREAVRRKCRTLFIQNLSLSSGAVAASLLLGDRSLMTDEIRTRFTESGTMHLLAISGLHVGILLGILYLVCRLLNLSVPRTVLVLIVLAVTYAALTNHRPPVLRATVLATFSLIGLAAARKTDGMNILALTALLLLMWRPADLFDVGAQLSFLAVGAILWVSRESRRRHRAEAEGPLVAERSWIVAALAPAGLWLRDGCRLTGAIWLATLPLTISVFHLVAPVGFLLNLLLIPFVAVVLGLGYLFLILGLLLPIAAIPVGWAFNGSLEQLLNLVGLARSLPGGHFYTAPLPGWWLLTFYVLLGGAWGLWGRFSCSAWAGRGLLAWIAIGLLNPSSPTTDGALRCTFLSVGHGLACVLELPGGETLLYDAGTIGDGRQAERAVERFLWSRNLNRIDAIVISHADHDHYSGVFGLLEKFPVGTLFVSREFLDFEQSGVADLCDTAASAGVPIRLIQAEDRLVPHAHRSVRGRRDDGGADARPTITVLHPPAGFQARDDNAASVVLDVRHAGRRLLLTGDLEREGLERVLSLPAEKTDVLLSPHHGGRAANPPTLLAWASPAVVIVSSGREDVVTQLDEIARTTHLLDTRTSGAITVTIDRDGQVTIDEFLTSRKFAQ